MTTVHPHHPVSRITMAIAASAALLVGLAGPAGAATLNRGFSGESYLDTGLPGATVAGGHPELAGVVLVDDLQAFDVASQSISGVVQNRVVRSNTTGNLIFTWRVTVDPGVNGGVSAFRLDQFGYGALTEGDWRIDGLGSAAPSTARLFNPIGHPDGAINFLFTDPAVQAGDGSRFFYLVTDAKSFAKTARYDLLGVGSGEGLSGLYSTYAPAVPEPASLALMLAGLAALGGWARRRAV